MNTNHQASPSLQVFLKDEPIFINNGKWLHPLFALEDFLSENEYTAADLYLKDSIIGKAAALLICRLGIRRIHGRLMSEPAVEYLRSRNAEFSWETLVPRIQCRTEELLAAVDDTEEAYTELSRRAGRK
ncbi:DUF1893 domain-containing protein [Marispirochaeta aestuarii]|uniref:DUF1893 domain-containing protein n=1 Tax=Marispirochaeta aestuarii TaxID=1963862 RepID=UPI002ABE8C50|nr:DUF1893 domain-containing protein [Marispirochaeta aestuarii]